MFLLQGQVLREIHGEGKISTVVREQVCPVEPDVRDLHSSLKHEMDPLALPCRLEYEPLAVPAHPLIIAASTGVKRFQANCMWQADVFP